MQMQKILFLCLVSLICLFSNQLYSSNGASAENKKIETLINQNRIINAGLYSRNESMILKISGLKGSPDALEALARMELNLIKRGEILVIIPENQKN